MLAAAVAESRPYTLADLRSARAVLEISPVTVSRALGELLEQTEQRVRDGVRSKATLEMQQAHRRYWERELGGRTRLGFVDELALERIASRPRLVPAHGRAPAGPNTLRKRLSTLKAALELQHRRRQLRRVPAFPKVLVRPAPRSPVIETYAQALALFRSLPLHRAEWYWLHLWTGQHVADGEGMAWADVDLGPRPTMLIRNTKNRRAPIRVPMPAPLAEVLRAKCRRERPAPSARIVQPWPSRKTTLAVHCARVGLPRLNATALRHTCLTWAVRRIGITPAVCAWAGHSSPEMMARRYAHALPAQLGEVAAALESMANDNGGEPT